MAKTTKASATGGQAGQPATRLGDALRDLAAAAGERTVVALGDRIGGTTDRLTRYTEGGGGSGLTGKLLASVGGRVAASLGGRRQGARGGTRVTNIVESIDVGVPVRIAYDQWSRFEDFPQFMKKVSHVARTSDTESTWKAQIFWSHREWTSTVVEQIPDRRIVWRSTGAKGSVDGTVTFHELGPDLTRVLLVLEYHPQGLFERTGNLWRAQGRRVRLELKHYARHVMTRTILHPEEVTGWRGEIRDGEVVRDRDVAGRGRRSGGRTDQPEPTGRPDHTDQPDQGEQPSGRAKRQGTARSRDARRTDGPDTAERRRGAGARADRRTGDPETAGRTPATRTRRTGGAR